MSFSHHGGPDCWYRPINPHEHIYTAGYGFSPTPPYLEELRLIARCSTATVICLLAFMFFSSFSYQLLQQLFLRILPADVCVTFYGPIDDIALAASAVFSLLLPFVIYAMHTRIPFEFAVPVHYVSPGLIAASVAVCMAVSVLGGYASDAVYTLFSAIDVYFYDPILVMPETVLDIMLFLLNTVIIPAVFEEIAFRGVIMQSLRRFGDSFALVVSSVLFAMVHISPLSVPNAFFMALTMGYFVLFTGSLHTGMVIHLINNLLAVLSTLLGQMDHATANIIFICIQIFYLLMGIIAILWLMKRYENIFSLKSSQTVNRSTAKIKRFFCTPAFFVFVIVVLIQAVEYIL